jgi:poly(A) polymerase
MLERGHAARALSRLRSLGLQRILLPETAEICSEAWTEVMTRVRGLLHLRTRRAVPLCLRRRLRAPIVAPRPRSALLVWAYLLTAARPSERPAAAWARETATRFALGAREASLLSALLRERDTAVELLRDVVTSGRELYRFVRRAEGWALEVVFFAAPCLDRPQPPSLPALVAVLDAVLEQEIRIAAPLLTGVEVMSLCSLPAGPAVGRALDALAEARAEGQVRTPEEAREWLGQRKFD